MVDVLELKEENRTVNNEDGQSVGTEIVKSEQKKAMDAKTTGIISYLSIVGWLIAYFTGDKEGARFHLNQSLILNAGWLLVSILSRFPRPIRYISWIAEMVLAILWIIGFIAAIKNEERKVPLLGEIQILR